MEMIWIIIILIVLLGVILVGITAYSKQKFFDLEIALNEAENNLDIILEKKMELFHRLMSHMKKKKLKIDYPDIEQYKKLKDDHHALHNALFDVYTEFISIVEENEDKLKDEKSISLIDQLCDNEDDLIAVVKYYNDSATDYNYYINHFPTSLGAKFLRLEQLEFFKNEKRETFEILKEDTKQA